MIVGLNKYGAYIFEQKYPNTEGLKVFKSETMSPKEKFAYFMKTINPIDTNAPGWLKFEYNGNIYFIRKRELVSILLTLANTGTPYYWGDFGTGKTVVATAVMKKLFGRIVVFRMLRNMTPVELFGQYDPITVHITVKLMEKHIMKDVTNEYHNKYDSKTAPYMITYNDIEKYFFHIPTNKVLELLPNSINRVKQVNFQFSSIGRALEENAGLLIDEIDKVTDYELTPLSSIIQDKNRYLPIPDFGAIEFNQPVILLGNSKDINKFIKSRVVRVKREHLPIKLFKELLIHENITNEVIIDKMIELYKYVETGELTIRDLINTAKNLQTFYSTHNGSIDPEVEQALLPPID